MWYTQKHLSSKCNADGKMYFGAGNHSPMFAYDYFIWHHDLNKCVNYLTRFLTKHTPTANMAYLPCSRWMMEQYNISFSPVPSLLWINYAIKIKMQNNKTLINNFASLQRKNNTHFFSPLKSQSKRFLLVYARCISFARTIKKRKRTVKNSMREKILISIHSTSNHNVIFHRQTNFSVMRLAGCSFFTVCSPTVHLMVVMVLLLAAGWAHAKKNKEIEDHEECIQLLLIVWKRKVQTHDESKQFEIWYLF